MVLSRLGIFAISAVVALMSIMPLYNQLKKQEERNIHKKRKSIPFRV